MTLAEAYSYLFFDSLMTSLIFPVKEIFVFVVMQIFGSYNMSLAIILAAIGSIFGHVINFGLGRLVVRSNKFVPQGNVTLKIIAFYKKTAPAFMLFCWVPFLGALLVVMAGSAMASWRKMFLFIIPIQAIYYVYLLNY